MWWHLSSETLRQNVHNWEPGPRMGAATSTPLHVKIIFKDKGLLINHFFFIDVQVSKKGYVICEETLDKWEILVFFHVTP